MHSSIALAFLTSMASAAPSIRQTATTCPIIFDGRVPSNATLTDFDTANGGGFNPYNPGFVKGKDLKWSEIIVFPESKACSASRFDAAKGTIPLEVTISDKSIFNNQNGFRRAGLMFNKDGNDASPASEGVVTLHFSVMQDESRPFNLTHEYLNVWHEAGDFSSNQFNFQTGTLIGQENLPADTYKLLDCKNKQIWATPILKGKWQNFAFTLDYEKNTIQAFYSDGKAPLKSVTESIANDLSGRGQYQIGVLKKPTGTSDVVNSGFQESGTNEGLIYGGIFIENSAGGCISL